MDIAHHYGFLDTGKSIVGRSLIRFIDRDHLVRLLAAANLIPITWYGDWDRTPLTPASREFIVVTRPFRERPPGYTPLPRIGPAGETADRREHEGDKSSEWRGRFSEHHQAD